MNRRYSSQITRFGCLAKVLKYSVISMFFSKYFCTTLESSPKTDFFSSYSETNLIANRNSVLLQSNLKKPSSGPPLPASGILHYFTLLTLLSLPQLFFSLAPKPSDTASFICIPSFVSPSQNVFVLNKLYVHQFFVAI